MTKYTKTEPESYTCPCGAKHEFDTWVFAHWREVITHICNSCNSQNELLKGRLLSSNK